MSLVEVGGRATDDPNRGPGFKPQQIWMCVAVDPEDGAEGAIALESVINGRSVMVPLIATDEARLKSIRHLGKLLGEERGEKITLICFTQRTELEVIHDPTKVAGIP